jgi:hypothetical protein
MPSRPPVPRAPLRPPNGLRLQDVRLPGPSPVPPRRRVRALSPRRLRPRPSRPNLRRRPLPRHLPNRRHLRPRPRRPLRLLRPLRQPRTRRRLLPSPDPPPRAPAHHGLPVPARATILLRRPRACPGAVATAIPIVRRVRATTPSPRPRACPGAAVTARPARLPARAVPVRQPARAVPVRVHRVPAHPVPERPVRAHPVPAPRGPAAVPVARVRLRA